MKKLHIKPVQEDIRRPLKPAVFFDLDGTIITTKSGKTFPTDDNDWKLIDGVRDLMLDLIKNQTPIIVVTNQGGIEEGFTTKAKFQNKVKAIVEALDLGIELNVYYSPTIDKEDIYRKPHAGMFHLAALELSIYLPNSVYVGDASGKFQIPKERVIKIEELEGVKYVTTKARQEAIAVIEESETTYTSQAWSDSDVAASFEAGIKFYQDIDQILHQFKVKTSEFEANKGSKVKPLMKVEKTD